LGENRKAQRETVKENKRTQKTNLPIKKMKKMKDGGPANRAKMTKRKRWAINKPLNEKKRRGGAQNHE